MSQTTYRRDLITLIVVAALFTGSVSWIRLVAQTLSPEADALAVRPDELPDDCSFSWKARPFVMRVSEPEGREDADLILGFWFGEDQVPLDSLRFALSNVLSTPENDYALTMLTMEFVSEVAAAKAEEHLKARHRQHATIGSHGKHVVLASGAAMPHCQAAASELQRKKVTTKRQ